jgi:hypothetical protein
VSRHSGIRFGGRVLSVLVPAETVRELGELPALAGLLLGFVIVDSQKLKCQIHAGTTVFQARGEHLF